LPVKARDPFGGEHNVLYDGYNLLVREILDPVGNTTSAKNDYRLLTPCLLTDPNQNKTAVDFDSLGMVVKTAVMGKNSDEGDTLEDPTTILEYNLHRWTEKTSKPVFVKTRMRERHRDPATPWQESYTYSDGLGREVMRKIQAEPERTSPEGDEERELDNIEKKRWVGTGRTIFDNKGNPIKKYEPYFSNTYEYEDEKEIVKSGVTPILRYDPLGRLIFTYQPNDTYSAVVFDAWTQSTWDENDTVVQFSDSGVKEFETKWYERWSRAPSSWPDVRGYAETYWGTVAALAAKLCVDIPKGVDASDETVAGRDEPRRKAFQKHMLDKLKAKKRAAELTVVHAGTPTVAHLDGLGRIFLNVAHNRTKRFREELVENKAITTRLELDIEGNQLSVIPSTIVNSMRVFKSPSRTEQVDRLFKFFSRSAV
jgi:hypothetical protein